MMCSNAEMLKEKAHWAGASIDSRSELFIHLQQIIPASLLVPENRLETLLTQAIAHQKSKCLYHSSESNDVPCLFSDHTCPR